MAESSKDDDVIVSMFMPPLLVVLQHAETAKGGPLTPAEVLKVRDDAAKVNVTKAEAGQIENKRGYRDVDPESVWKEWQVRRLEFIQRDEAEAAD